MNKLHPPPASARHRARYATVAFTLAACGGTAHPGDAGDAGMDVTLDTAPDTAPDTAMPTWDAGPLAREPAPMSFGYDAYRHWDHLPYHRLGARTYMRSTYDRTGGNDAVDASHFLREESPDASVTLDVAGRGVLYFVRTNHWHGSPWHYVVDGTDHVIAETSTATPDMPVAGSEFLPSGVLPEPLAWTWSATHGADLNWVPAPFDQSFKLAYGRTHYGTGYYIYQLYADDVGPSPALTPWDATTPPPTDVVDLIDRAGDDIAPAAGEPGVRTEQGTVALPAGETVVPVAALSGAPSVVRALRLTVPRAEAEGFASARLRITWDDRDTPSIDAPVSLFFGAGTLRNPDARDDLVKALLATIHFDADTVTLAMYYPMPFRHSARLELVSGDAAVSSVQWQIRTVPLTDPVNQVGYFHATYRDHTAPVTGKDLVLLDTTAPDTEGGGDWCGSFVGTSFVFTDTANLGTLEGDPRFFFDDSETPQGYGTGTEEWAGGGDYWGGRTMTLPFAGHPVGVWPPAADTLPADLVHSAYRFLLADAMPFGRNARIQLEHGGLDDSNEHYRTVAYWYGAPSACLVRTDELHVGDDASEQQHAYVSASAQPVETLTSRFEVGVDHANGMEVVPETTDTGRRMTGTSEFRLGISPDNLGVLLRRRLDYSLRDQRADVSVAEDRDGAPFVPVGTWYLAGSNTCVYSNPPTELGAPVPMLQESNRRFREDEFLLPRRVTQGRSSIRVRIENRTVVHPLTPGETNLPPGEWSEYRYWAYSYVMPQ